MRVITDIKRKAAAAKYGITSDRVLACNDLAGVNFSIIIGTTTSKWKN